MEIDAESHLGKPPNDTEAQDAFRKFAKTLVANTPASATEARLREVRGTVVEISQHFGIREDPDISKVVQVFDSRIARCTLVHKSETPKFLLKTPGGTARVHPDNK